MRYRALLCVLLTHVWKPGLRAHTVLPGVVAPCQQSAIEGVAIPVEAFYNQILHSRSMRNLTSDFILFFSENMFVVLKHDTDNMYQVLDQL